MDWAEYQEKWWCDGLVRNQNEVGEINAGQLWLTRGNERIVVNDCFVDVSGQVVEFEKIF